MFFFYGKSMTFVDVGDVATYFHRKGTLRNEKCLMQNFDFGPGQEKIEPEHRPGNKNLEFRHFS